MSAQQNMQIVRRFYDQVINGRNLDVMEELFAATFHGYTVEHKGELIGLDSFRREIAALRDAFPDYRLTIEDCFASGDKVAVRWAACGTHRGLYLGVPATGKRVTAMGLGVFRLAGGKIVEHWCAADTLDIIMQLDVVPS
jgi:steroid delta-isomerase-like uncharacterized protein